MFKKKFLNWKIAGGLVAIATIAITTLFFLPKKVSADWWDEGWQFRQLMTLPTHSGLENNVYFTISVDTATLVTAGKLQSDCGDLRFTRENGNLLPYYIESGCNSGSTSIQVFFDTYEAGVVRSFMYYGNASAENGTSASTFTTLASNGSATLNYQVNASSDDGDQNSNNLVGNITNTGVKIGNDSNAKVSGFRFTSVAVPQGASITSAIFTGTSDSTYSCGGCTIQADIFGEDVDDSATFTTVDGNISQRTRTTANTSTGSLASFTLDTEYDYTVTSQVQEIIDRGGWASGNDLTILFADSGSTGSEWQQFWSYDGSTTKAAQLTITISGGSASFASEESGPGPVVWWKFDENQGTTAYDSTPQGNNATLGGSIAGISENIIRQEINIIDSLVTTSGDHSAIVQLDTAKYSGDATYYFETLATVSADTLNVNLERVGTSTVDATIAVTTSSELRQRVEFTPPAGATEYNISLSGGTTPNVGAARIIVLQSEDGITTTSSQIEIGNEETGKTNTSAAALTSPKYWHYEANNWDPSPTFYAETTYLKDENNPSFTPTFVAVGATGANTAAITPAWPAGHQAGDIGILVLETAGNQPAASAPSGWTAVTGSPMQDVVSAAGSSLHVFWRRATSSAEAVASIADTGDHQIARIYVFRGVATTGDPWDVVANNTKATASTTATSPSVTTTVDNTLVLNIVGRPSDDASVTHFSNPVNSNLTNLSELAEAGTTTGHGGGFVIVSGEMTNAGSTGTTTHDKAASTTDTLMTLALKPANMPYVAGAGALVSSANTMSVVWPTHQEDDIGILVVESSGNQPYSSTPTGWQHVSGSPVQDFTTTAGSSLSVLWRRAQSASEANVSVTDTGDHQAARIITVRNALQSGDPIEVATTGTKTTGSTTATSPSITTTENNQLIVLAVSRPDDSASTAHFSATTNATLDYVGEAGEGGTTAGNGGGFLIAAGGKAAAGSTGTTTHTKLASTTDAYISFSLRPAIVTNEEVTITLQEDNGSFSGWSDKQVIVNGSTTANTVSRVRSSSFTPTDGRNYRIVGSTETGVSSYDIFNAKIIAEQTGGVNELESQYLLLNRADFAATGLQNYNTLWDASEWANITNTFYYSHDASNAADSSKLQDIDNGNADITNATATGANQQIAGTAFTMPASGNELDVNVTNTTGEVAASRIIALSTINEPGGTVTAPEWIDDQCLSSTCLYFDGVGEGVVRDNSASIDFDDQLNNGVTFSAWVKANSAGGSDVGQIINKGTDTYLRVGNLSAGKLDLVGSLDLASSDATFTATGALTQNNWHHVVLAYTDDGDDEITLYVDGNAVGTSTNGSGAPASDANKLIIGHGDSAGPFHGFIDDVRVYSYQRTEEEIKNLALSPLAGGTGLGSNIGAEDKSYLSDGLVGWWQMEDGGSGNGITTQDSSGNGRTATSEDAGTTLDCNTSGKFGRGCVFDGTDDSFDTSVGATSLGIDGANPRTIAGWVNTSQFAFDIAFGLGGTASDSYFGIATKNSSDSWIVETRGTDLDFHVPDSSGNWTHVVATYDGTTIRAYANGVLISEAVQTLNTTNGTTSNQSFMMGEGVGAGSQFNGSIDDVRVYNRALSDSEVAQLHSWAPKPIAHWKLDENTGTALQDSSSSNIPATLSAASWIPGKYGSAFRGAGSNYFCSGSGSCADNDILDFGSGGFTIGFWYKSDSDSNPGSTQVMLNKGSNTEPTYMVRVAASGKPAFLIDDDTTFDGDDSVGNISSQTDTYDGNWHYMTVVKDGTNSISMYNDGILIETKTGLTATGNIASTDPLHIGDRNGSDDGNEFAGSIDDVRFYNYPRSSSQIIEDMNGDHPIGGSPVGSQVAYWKMDEGYGDFAYDSRANTNIYLAGGDTCPGDSECPTWTNDGKFGKGLSFDGDDYMEASAIPALDNNGTDPYTATVWFKSNTNPTNNYEIMGIFSNFGSFQDRFIQVTSAGLARFYVYDGAEKYATGSTDVIDDQWHHLAGVFDGDTIYIYVDGKLEGSTATNGSQNHTDPWIRFSAFFSGYSEHTVGTVDEAKVYTTALSQEEIIRDMNRGNAALFGNTSTASDGTTSDNSAAREYCVPGDTSNCSAPVFHGKFDENTGTTINNVSGYGASGSHNADWTPGKIGSALEFNGSSDYGEFTDYDELDITGDLTLSAWVYLDTDTAGYKTIVSKGAGPNYYMTIDESERVESGYGGYFPDSNTSISLNEWHHLVWVIDETPGASNDTAYYYINGRLDKTESNINLSGITTNDQELDIGIYDSGTDSFSEWWPGKIDDVRVYDYARTAAQVAWEYNQGAPVAHYKFDECSGTTTYNSAINANGDSVGVHGTLVVGGSGSNTSVGDCSSGVTTESRNNGTTGKYNASLSFDGNDDYVTVSDNNLLDFETNSFSVAAWVKHDTPVTGQDYILHKWDSGTAGGYGLNMESSGAFRFGIEDDGTSFPEDSALSSQSFDDGQWHYVVGVKTGTSKIELYVDGILAAQDASINASNTLNNAVDLQIGARYDLSQTWQGQIDEVKIFNYPLTSNQIRTEMNAGAINFR